MIPSEAMARFLDGEPLPELKAKVGRFTIKQVGPESDRVLRFVGTDETSDRDGDILTASGWDFTNYLKNPVFLPFHDYHSIPPGKCVAINQAPGSTGTSFDIKFASISELCPDNQDNPSQEAKFAETLYQAFRHGYMNAVSVGFVPKKSEERTDQMDKPQWSRGRIITEKEMLELSAVSVPSNPNALIQARSAKSMKPDQIGLLEKLFSMGQKDEVDPSTMDLPGVKAKMKEFLSGAMDLSEGAMDALYKSLSKRYEELGEKAPDLKAYTAEEIKTMFDQEGEMDEKAVQKAIGEAVAPLLEEIKTLKEALGEKKSGAKYSAATKAKLQGLHDAVEKALGMCKELVSDSGTSDTEEDRNDGVQVPGPNVGDDGKGIDLSKVDLKKYGLGA